MFYLLESYVGTRVWSQNFSVWCFLLLVARKFIHLLVRDLTYMVDQWPWIFLSISTNGISSLMCDCISFLVSLQGKWLAILFIGKILYLTWSLICLRSVPISSRSDEYQIHRVSVCVLTCIRSISASSLDLDTDLLFLQFISERMLDLHSQKFIVSLLSVKQCCCVHCSKNETLLLF